MNTTLAFDVYGTLFDTASVVTALASVVGEDAPAVGALWRSKQLEYAFRRALMKRYADFSVCTRQALLFACTAFGHRLMAAQTEMLTDAYANLAPFADTQPAIAALKAAGHDLNAFSNGEASAVQALLDRAGLRSFFSRIISVAPTASFKPDPVVYAHCLAQTGTRAEATWLVSSNAFDVIGAAAFGMNTAWVRRTPDAILDPWDMEPTVTLASLLELPTALAISSRAPG